MERYCPSVPKESVLCILYHPSQAMPEVEAGHGATGHNGPTMGLDGIQLQALQVQVSIRRMLWSVDEWVGVGIITPGTRTVAYYMRSHSPAESPRRSCIRQHRSYWQRSAETRPSASVVPVSERLRAHRRPASSGPDHAPLPTAGQPVPSGSRRAGPGRLHPRPRSGRRSSQSNCASRIAASSAHRRPLCDGQEESVRADVRAADHQARSQTLSL